MGESRDVVIVGGGIAGCAVAYYLARVGIKATVIEREGVGMQASGYSAGGLNPLHGIAETLKPLAMESFRLHQDLQEALRQATGQGYQARPTSMIKVALNEAAVPPLQELLTIFNATAGFQARWLDQATIRTLEPRLTPDFQRALQLQGNGVVDSHRCTVLLARASVQMGASIRSGTVHGLQHHDGRVTGVLVDNEVLSCGQVVLAMGPWAQQAEAWLHFAVPVEPLKGEILRLELPGPALAHDFDCGEGSLYSRGDGQVWCGGTEERCGFDKSPTAAARHKIWQTAIRLMPALSEAWLVQQTVCLRPVAPDGLPIVGRVPGWDNVYLAAGGAKKGILLSPAMGKAIADLLHTGHTTLSIDPCTPERFRKSSVAV